MNHPVIVRGAAIAALGAAGLIAAVIAMPPPPASSIAVPTQSNRAPLFQPLTEAPSDLAEAPVATTGDVPAGEATTSELTLVLSAERSEVPFGEVAAIAGTFFNGTEEPIVLIEPVDASTDGGRTPAYHWVVERTDGMPVRRRETFRMCGMMNPLVREDFRTLPPGESWSMGSDEPWLMPPQMYWSFTEPGEYRIQLRYVVNKELENLKPKAFDGLWGQAFEGVVPSSSILLRVDQPAEAYADRLARRRQVPVGGSRAEAETVMGTPDHVSSSESQGETYLVYYLAEPSECAPLTLDYPRFEEDERPRVIVTLGDTGVVTEVVLLP